MDYPHRHKADCSATIIFFSGCHDTDTNVSNYCAVTFTSMLTFLTKNYYSSAIATTKYNCL